MNKLINGLLLAAMLMFAVLQAQAQDVAPDALAKRVTDEVLAVLRADKDIQAGNTKKLQIGRAHV